LALGQKRADAVRQGLTLLGVNAAQVESVSFGEEKPAVLGNDESAFSMNRRAEFFYK
jgi:peptidoglycan-associated lipoprotein